MYRIFVVVQSLSRVWLFVATWTATHQAFLFTLFWSLLKLMSIELVMPSNHLILCHPLSCLQSFPESGSFQMSQFFTIGGQSIGVSALASVPPKKSQGWYPSQWTGLISLLSKGLSRVFSNITFKSINSLVLSLLYDPTLTATHGYWKNHRKTIWKNFCQQSDVPYF